MSVFTWRQRLANTVADVLAANKGKSKLEIADALREACPFRGMGKRENAVWRQEVQRALGVTPGTRHWKPSSRDPIPPEQVALF